MSRITPPVTKLSQTLRASSRSSSSLLKAAAARNNVESKQLTADLDGSRSHTTLSAHRPTAPTAEVTYKPRPLMQGFRTSAPKQQFHQETINIDHIVLPDMFTTPHGTTIPNIRVPLLPDNFFPDRSVNSLHPPEPPVAAVPTPEISLVAAHPEVVAPLTEIVNNAGLEIDVGHWIARYEGQQAEKEAAEQSALREILGGIIGDFFKGSPKST